MTAHSNDALVIIPQSEWDAAQHLKPQRQVESIDGFSDLEGLVGKMTSSMLDSPVLAERQPVVALVHVPEPSNTALITMNTIRITMIKSRKVRVTYHPVDPMEPMEIRHRPLQESIYKPSPKITPLQPQYLVGIDLIPVVGLPSHYKFTITLYDSKAQTVVWQEEKEIRQRPQPFAPDEAWHHRPGPVTLQER